MDSKMSPTDCINSLSTVSPLFSFIMTFLFLYVPNKYQLNHQTIIANRSTIFHLTLGYDPLLVRKYLRAMFKRMVSTRDLYQ